MESRLAVRLTFLLLGIGMCSGYRCQSCADEAECNKGTNKTVQCDGVSSNCGTLTYYKQKPGGGSLDLIWIERNCFFADNFHGEPCLTFWDIGGFYTGSCLHGCATDLCNSWVPAPTITVAA